MQTRILPPKTQTTRTAKTQRNLHPHEQMGRLQTPQREIHPNLPPFRQKTSIPNQAGQMGVFPPHHAHNPLQIHPKTKIPLPNNATMLDHVLGVSQF